MSVLAVLKVQHLRQELDLNLGAIVTCALGGRRYGRPTERGRRVLPSLRTDAVSKTGSYDAR